ncbi:MAG: 5'-methylthioadenosine/S-adenosylhomocysteine nucleosidase [Acutalibacteraceae bacterium]|nr:5'-methylthioadenosine/S-adenosylhomocysteine nucleosidase [Acutalibacteraceae bacterium]
MKIGLVIADDMEFEPVAEKSKLYNGESYNICGDRAVSFETVCGNKIVAVLCGTGKVNAAGATAALICKEKPDCIINIGLSGAIKGVYKNDIVIGTKFLEHDFDLTPLGYEVGVKPQHKYIYEPDSELFKRFCEKFSKIKPCVFVTGDMFVSSKEKKDFIIEKFDGGCCDMESAAVASVCYKMEVSFLSLRKLSDDADESAADIYRESNNLKEDVLINMIISLFG